MVVGIGLSLTCGRVSRVLASRFRTSGYGLFSVSPTYHLKPKTGTGDQGKVGETHRASISVRMALLLGSCLDSPSGL